MIKRVTVVVALLALMLVSAIPAAAITDGELDGNAHPYVGLMVAHGVNPNTGNYGPLWRCSGTLLSSTVFLTAGHCTEAPADHVEIWFDADVQSGIPGNGYPNNGDVGGTPYTHPGYLANAFFYRDLGVVVLDTPMAMSSYGALPSLNQSDGLLPKASTKFTAVGYGLQKSFSGPVADTALRIRMVANPKLVQINTGFTGDFSLLLSNNAHTGGTCFGDSGGPNFYYGTNVIAGVTSYGLNGSCAGTGGAFRVDRSWSLNWVATFFD